MTDTYKALRSALTRHASKIERDYSQSDLWADLIAARDALALTDRPAEAGPGDRPPIEAYDDGSAVYLVGYNGGGHPKGSWSALSLMFTDAAGEETYRDYIHAPSPAPAETVGEKGRQHRFGSPPEPVANPSADWCDAYADWYYQGSR